MAYDWGAMGAMGAIGCDGCDRLMIGVRWGAMGAIGAIGAIAFKSKQIHATKQKRATLKERPQPGLYIP